jgi:hypothetical protein
MHTDVALMQLSHYNVCFLITAIVYHTWFNFIKSTSVSVQVVEVQLLDVELVEVQVSVEVQLTVTSTNRERRKSRTGIRSSSSRTASVLANKKPNLNKLGRRDMPKSQLK